MNLHRKFGAALAALAGAACVAGAAQAADFPNRTLRIIVPYQPGGSTDIVVRKFAELAAPELGQSIIIENKGGAGATMGARTLATATPDGYTLLLSSGSTFTVTPHLMRQMPYTLEDFAPVAAIATVPFAFVVKKDFPARSVAEYVAYAQTHPGKINNATNGQGSMVHLLGELVATGLRAQVTQVHYKGAAPATMDMIGGIVDSNVEALTSALPNVQAGQYRALAVLSAERQPLMPDVPTFRELGYPSIVGETWYAVFAPAGTPAPVVEKLNAALREITGSTRFAEAMRKLGNEARTSTPAELTRITQRESQRWGELIKQAGIPPVQ